MSGTLGGPFLQAVATYAADDVQQKPFRDLLHAHQRMSLYLGEFKAEVERPAGCRRWVNVRQPLLSIATAAFAAALQYEIDCPERTMTMDIPF